MTYLRHLILVVLCAIVVLSATADPAWTEGEEITIANGETVALTASTPKLKSLTVAGTLTLANWETCVKAETVTVASGGVIKPVAAFTDSEMSNRVWIACDTLTVASGGKINADALGYVKRNGPAWAGVSTTAINSGGAYGGKGGKGSAKTYGSVEYPADPGSGGVPYQSANTCLLAGGGAIRLEVEGALIVNGTISAIGSGPGGTIYSGGGMGSGGGIWIDCETIDGSGKILAHGTLTTSSGESVYVNGGGGGGRIAVHYNSSAQAAKDDTCHVRFDARGGSAVIASGCNDLSKGYPGGSGGWGSLYFTDSRFLTSSAYRQRGWCFAGEWKAPGPIPESVVVNGDFLLDNCAVKLPIKTLTVGGNLNVNGNLARTQIFELTNATVSVAGDFLIAGGGFSLYGGTLAVGGDLVISPLSGQSTKCYAGELYLMAAPTNGTDKAVGIVADVKGEMKLSGHSFCRMVCHPTDGAIPELRVNSLDVTANGWLTADESGWGPESGPGYASGKGGAYGGAGSGSYANNPKCYGDECNPICPGSGSNGNGGQTGGGVVKVLAKSRIRITGKISASGRSTAGNWVHGASGGSVNLKCYKLMSSTGKIQAIGAPGCGYAHRGGGGRIALTYFSGVTNGLSFSATKGGGSDYTYITPVIDATDGTVYVNHKPARLMVIIR